MKIEGDYLRGYTDAIILSILEKEDNYGYQVNLEISNRSENKIFFTEATLYTSFKRLEKEELILSYWKDGINTKRKYYSITELGRIALKTNRKIWNNNKEVIEKFLGGK